MSINLSLYEGNNLPMVKVKNLTLQAVFIMTLTPIIFQRTKLVKMFYPQKPPLLAQQKTVFDIIHILLSFLEFFSYFLKKKSQQSSVISEGINLKVFWESYYERFFPDTGETFCLRKQIVLNFRSFAFGAIY